VRPTDPTQYGLATLRRSNAGVASVSALVFDQHRVPPDPERLAGVHWVRPHDVVAHAYSATLLPYDPDSRALDRRFIGVTMSSVLHRTTEKGYKKRGAGDSNYRRDL
jgi:hypothetical protein